MKIYEVSGSHYEQGVAVGKLFEKAIVQSLEETRPYYKQEEAQRDFLEMREKLEQTYPDYLDHVYGKADGAGVDRQEYLFNMCSEYFFASKSDDHCTDIMIKVSEEESLLGHNEDGDYSLENIALIKYITPDGYFYDYTGTDSLPGGSFTFNSHGLLFTMNYMHMDNKQPKELCVWFLLRDIVEATNIEEVKERLENKHVASGCNINVVDYETSKIFTIEVKHNRVDIIEVEDKYAHANHYIHPCFNEHFSYPTSNSLFRQAKAEQMLEHVNSSKATLENVEKILAYRHESYFNSIKSCPDMGKNITAATLLYSTKTRKIRIVNHMDDTTIELDNIRK